MTASSDVTTGAQGTAAQYNNLRADMLAADAHVTSHTHRPALWSGTLSATCSSTPLVTGLVAVINASGAAQPTVGNKTNGNAAAVTLPTGSNGDLMILAARTKGANEYVSVPTGWTRIMGAPATSTTGSLDVFYRIRQAGDTGPTLSGSIASGVSWGCVAYGGVHAQRPIHGYRIAALATGATLSFGTVEFAIPDEYDMAVMVAGHGGATAYTWTPATNWTEDQDAYGIEFSHRALTAAIATTAADGVTPPFAESILATDTSYGTAGAVLASLTLSPGRYLLHAALALASGANPYSVIVTPLTLGSNPPTSQHDYLFAFTAYPTSMIVDLDVTTTLSLIAYTTTSTNTAAAKSTFLQALRLG